MLTLEQIEQIIQEFAGDIPPIPATDQQADEVASAFTLDHLAAILVYSAIKGSSKSLEQARVAWDEFDPEEASTSEVALKSALLSVKSGLQEIGQDLNSSL